MIVLEQKKSMLSQLALTLKNKIDISFGAILCL